LSSGLTEAQERCIKDKLKTGAIILHFMLML